MSRGRNLLNCSFGIINILCLNISRSLNMISWDRSLHCHSFIFRTENNNRLNYVNTDHVVQCRTAQKFHSIQYCKCHPDNVLIGTDFDSYLCLTIIIKLLSLQWSSMDVCFNFRLEDSNLLFFLKTELIVISLWWVLTRNLL